jgi:hypothetical protein
MYASLTADRVSVLHLVRQLSATCFLPLLLVLISLL